MEDKNKNTDQPPPYSAATNYPGVYQEFPASAPPPYNNPPPGYQPYQNVAPNIGFMPSYGATQQGSTTSILITQPIIAVGACPACRIGILEDDFTCLGIMCAILFFPLGIICCMALKNRRCSNCGAYFG